MYRDSVEIGGIDMGTSIKAAETTPGSWDTLSDIDAFATAVMNELKMMESEGIKICGKGPKPPLDGAVLRRAIMAIWCTCYCSTQWRAVGNMTGIPFGTLFSLFSRWTRLGVFRRLRKRLIVQWRDACGDTPMLSAVIVDSRSVRSSPTCGDRGIDGGKLVKGLKIHIAVDKHGFPLSVKISTANVHDSVGILPVLQELSAQGFTGHALVDSSYKGSKLSKAAKELGIDVIAKTCGAGRNFLPEGIRWVVERSFAWLSRYRRLNTFFDRTSDSLVAHIEIAFISILSRRIARLKPVSA
ncbi:MAG: IS5 family transposase [Alphaproteobacteria bacterium]